MTKSQRRLQGLVVFMLSILLILGSMMIALTEDRFRTTNPAPTSPVLRSATPPPDTTSSSRMDVISFKTQMFSPDPYPGPFPPYEIS